MCGLVGMMTSGIATDKQLDLLAGLLYVDQVRGKHATGVAKINPAKGTVDIHKKAVSAQLFLGLEETQEFLDNNRGRIYIGHNRYATHGDKSKHENAHPFQEGHITLVHNGGVDTWAMDKLEGHDELVVDSHMVCRTIAEHGIEEAVKRFSGAFALVWWDDNLKTLNFIRNSDRPLWMAELSDGSIYWASEKQFLDFFVDRKKNGLSYKVAPKELPTNLHVYWTFSENGVLKESKPTSKEIKFTKIPDPNPTPNYSNYYGQGNTHYGKGATYYGSSKHVDNYNRRANDLLNFHKIDAKVDQRIVVKVERVEDHHSNPERVNIHASYKGIDCILYFLKKDEFLHAKHISAVINNCHERLVNYQGVEWKDPLITLRAHGAEVEQAQLKVVPAAVGQVFPLKANGHTFTNSAEFVDFVSTGCTCCGKIPATNDKRNKLMTIYPLPHFGGLLKDCEFICGECISEEGNKE